MKRKQEQQNDFQLDFGSPKSAPPQVDISNQVKQATRGIVLKTVGAMTLVFTLGCGVFYYTAVYSPPAIEVDYNLTGKKPLDVFEKALAQSNISELNSLLSSGDSWISKEFEYANGSDMRDKFIKTVLNNVEFQYPEVQAQNKRGLMYDKAGNPILTESNMLNGENLIVSHIDYNALATTFQEKSDDILRLVATKGYQPTDYLYKDEMVNCMIEFILSLKDLPTKSSEVEVSLVNDPIESTDKKGRVSYTDNYVLENDISLDKLLFSSDDFHRMCDSFAMVISGWKPNIVQQEQDNPAYAEYQRGIADGSISANTKAPDKKIMVNVVQGDSFPTEQIVPYTWIGSYYLQNEYSMDNPILPQSGNGTFDRPAGLGTYIVTKAIDTSGTAHDVLLTLTKFITEQKAIDYLASFDEQNRGISNTANVKMLCAEFEVKNLDSVPITITEDMVLCDRNAQASSKTGNIYGLTETITLEPNETKTIQSWFASTDLNRKYMVWGRSFGRSYPVVWFDVLANQQEEVDKDKDKATESEVVKDDKSSDES
jgi:hypothetical protein